MTRAERVAQLEGMLEASIASHDGVLLREREYALSRANQRGSEDELEAAGGGGGLPYDEPGQGGSDAEGSAGSRAEGTDAGMGREGADQTDGTSTSGSTTGPGAQKTAGTYPAPAGIPSGSDDDVVARQIREAAENEPDPVLREKLWEEYRKYKNL